MAENVQTSKTAGASERGIRKTLVGFVVRDKMDKTVIVEVLRTFSHPQFKKYVRTKKRYMAHDERNECKVGDKVQIVEARPRSKNKRWRVRSILT